MLLNRSFVLFIIICFIFLGTVFLEYCRPEGSKSPIVSSNEFVGDQACKNCHKTEYSQWQQSDHFMAMQPADDSTVEGNFNNANFSADGVTSHFFRKDGKFIINTQGEDGANHDYEVKYTFGFKPLQQYLIEFPGGKMQVPRVSWDTKQNKWFHQYTGQKIPAHDWLHWTNNAQNWNTMCASCHSTNLQKNYSLENDSYNTTYSVINVSCESCHGAGKLHIDYVNSSAYKQGEKISGSYLQLNQVDSQLSQINTCAPCHARKADISSDLVHSNEILDNYIPEIPSTEHFYADGQVNDEDYIYTSFLQSKMFRRGIKCSNCHNPHSAKLLFADNQLCLQCHDKKFNEPTHTFHTINTEGAACKNCHMPGKFYMGNDFRHDHSFRVPRPDLSVQYGTPNACTNCHKDKSAEWASAVINKWYGPVRKYHFAEDLIPGSGETPGSEARLIKLLGDTAVPAIIKATAAFYLGNHFTNQSLSALLKCLGENEAQIRYMALKGLSNFPADNWISAVGPLLSDPVRGVRIAAAELFITIPQEQVPISFREAFVKAKSELHNYVMYQADFSVGNNIIADYYLKQQDYANAEFFYLRALKKDSMMNYARLNLSSAYNALGKNKEALQVLQAAAAIDPGNSRIYYNLGLLYYEMNQPAEAMKSFAKAIDLKTQNPRVFYNYGILLQQQGKIKEAAEMFENGLRLSPTDADLNYVLALLYLQNGQIDKARQPASVLIKYFPNNPDYQKIFSALGMK